MTSTEGSGTRARRGPARSGLVTAAAAAIPSSSTGRWPVRGSGLIDSLARAEPALARPSLLLHRVAAELLAQRRGELHRVAVVLTRGEAREQRVRERGHRHVVRDRLA